MNIYSPTLGPGTLIYRFKPADASLAGDHLLTHGAPVANGKVLSDALVVFDAPNAGAASVAGYDYTGSRAELAKVTQRILAYA